MLGDLKAPTQGYCSKVLADTSATYNHAVCSGGSTTDIGELTTIDWIQNCDAYGSFRIGFDWGHGGGVIVDGVLVHFAPSNIYANWYDGNWGSNDLNGVIAVPEQLWTAGRHIIQFVGFEPCCDGNGEIDAMPRGGSWAPVHNTFSFPCTSGA